MLKVSSDSQMSVMITLQIIVLAAVLLFLQMIWMMMSDWVYNGSNITEAPEGAIGFVYLVTRLDTGRKYIGKKLLTFMKTKVVKGKKKR